MFNNIIGNRPVKETLINTVKQDTVSNSYLFVGIDGIREKVNSY